MTGFAKDYWELGALALGAAFVGMNPEYKPLYVLGSFGVAGYCASIFGKNKKKESPLKDRFRAARDVMFYFGAGIILDKNMDYMASLPEFERAAAPAIMLLSSYVFDNLMSKSNESKPRSRKNLENKLK